MPGQAPPTAFFRCENGVVMEMDLPLPEGIAQRVERGAIVRVANADGAPYLAGDDAIGTPEVPAPPTKRPADSANKPAWVAWAVACGADPEEASGANKGDLIERYGNSEPAPPAPAEPAAPVGPPQD